MSAISFLPKDFHLVLWTVVYTIIMNVFLTMKVVQARKKFDVKYPALYSKDHAFNCVQRAHQNTLEQLPIFLILLLLVGFALPKYAAVCGAIFVTSRFSYAYGYYTGDPKKRMNGEYGVIGQLGLLGGLVYVALLQGGYIEQISFKSIF